MGLLDWFRSKQDDEPDIIQLPSVRPPGRTYWCEAVTIDEAGLTGVAMRGPDLRLEFRDLDRIAIRTTDEGPGEYDVFWLLVAGEQECLVPQGAPGETDLFERLSKLPQFNYQAMITAMTSTADAEFECWTRNGTT